MQGGYVVAYAFVVELGFLGGREKLLPGPRRERAAVLRN